MKKIDIIEAMKYMPDDAEVVFEYDLEKREFDPVNFVWCVSDLNQIRLCNGK